jgi:hypothetical protein
MAFAEDAAGAIDENDAQCSAIVESQRQRNVEAVGSVPRGFCVDLALDAKETRDRKPGTVHQTLIPADLIVNPSQGAVIPNQFSEAGTFFDEFEHAGGFYPA